jgi:hypothetical protein
MAPTTPVRLQYCRLATVRWLVTPRRSQYHSGLTLHLGELDCCPQSNLCCPGSTFCKESPSDVCCPGVLCPSGFECSSGCNCISAGGQCCSDGRYCEKGNICVIDSYGRQGCCTDLSCTAYVTSVVTVTASPPQVTITEGTYYYFTITWYALLPLSARRRRQRY